MKTRKPSTVSKNEIMRISGIEKLKYSKTIKNKGKPSEGSYCDTHNIGKRKSNSNVVTYSLNSHLFFDVYAKFDKSSINRSNVISKKNRRSVSPLLSKPIISSSSLCKPVCDNISIDTMSNCNSSDKSMHKRPKVLSEAQPVGRDESLIPSPKLENITPFRSSRPAHIPLSKSELSNYQSTANSHSNHIENSHTNTETFLRILENKTVFKKHLSDVSPLPKSITKLKGRPKAGRPFSKKTRKVGKCKQHVELSDDRPMNGTLTPLCQQRSLRSSTKLLNIDTDLCNPTRQKRMASLNAAAIINCVQSLLKYGRKNSKFLKKGIETGDIKLELEKEQEPERKFLMIEEMKMVSKKKGIVSEHGKRRQNKVLKKEIEYDSLSQRTITDVKKCDQMLNNGIKKEADEGMIDMGSLWSWEGESEERFIQVQMEGAMVSRKCYSAIKHTKDDVVIKVQDCVMLKSVDQEPYLAKITALYADQETGKKMMSLLWYYRPEHTEQGRQAWHTEADVYASQHLDTNVVDCIEDRAFVLPLELFGRFISDQKRQDASTRPGLGARIMPVMCDDRFDSASRTIPTVTSDPPVDTFTNRFYYSPNFQFSFPPEMTVANVFVCRGIYDFRQRKVTKTITALLQSPSREPPERCVSSASLGSISSCNSRLEHTPVPSIAGITNHDASPSTRATTHRPFVTCTTAITNLDPSSSAFASISTASATSKNRSDL